MKCSTSNIRAQRFKAHLFGVDAGLLTLTSVRCTADAACTVCTTGATTCAAIVVAGLATTATDVGLIDTTARVAAATAVATTAVVTAAVDVATERDVHIGFGRTKTVLIVGTPTTGGASLATTTGAVAVAATVVSVAAVDVLTVDVLTVVWLSHTTEVGDAGACLCLS